MWQPGATVPGYVPTAQTAIDSNTNRLVAQSGSIGYSASGKWIQYGSAQLTYDFENRIVKKTQTAIADVSYVYDGDGLT